MLKIGISGLALLALLAILASGCGVASIHPLYTQGDAVAEPAVVGMWVDTESTERETWKFFKKPNLNAYTLIYSERGVPAWFDARLTKIGDALYMDTYPVSKKDGDSGSGMKNMNSLTQIHLIAGHLFWRMEVKGPVLKIAILDPDMLKEQLDAGTVSVAHEYEVTSDGDNPTLILTAPTAELREFVLKSADRVFGEPIKLQRKPAK